MVVTRSINSQNITRSKAGQTYHHLQLVIPKKRKRSQKPTSTENVSKTIPVVYDYEPKYWIEEETQPIYSSLEAKPEIKQEDFTKDDESVITEVEDLLLFIMEKYPRHGLRPCIKAMVDCMVKINNFHQLEFGEITPYSRGKDYLEVASIGYAR